MMSNINLFEYFYLDKFTIRKQKQKVYGIKPNLNYREKLQIKIKLNKYEGNWYLYKKIKINSIWHRRILFILYFIL